MIHKSLKVLTFLILFGGISSVQVAKADFWQTTKETALGASIGAVAGEFIHAPLMGAAIGGGLALATHLWNRIETAKAGGATIQTIHLDDQLIIIVPSDTIFEPNTAEFRSGAENVLNDLAEILYQHSDENIHISANLDPINSGLEWHHLSLSEQQAEQVSGYFWMKGVRSGNTHRQLSYSGDDARYSIATNQLLAGMTTNRRIQITVYPHQLADYPKSAPMNIQWSNWGDTDNELYRPLDASTH